jgi:hypothetical protein
MGGYGYSKYPRHRAAEAARFNIPIIKRFRKNLDTIKDLSGAEPIGKMTVNLRSVEKLPQMFGQANTPEELLNVIKQAKPDTQLDIDKVEKVITGTDPDLEITINDFLDIVSAQESLFDDFLVRIVKGGKLASELLGFPLDMVEFSPVRINPFDPADKEKAFHYPPIPPKDSPYHRNDGLPIDPFNPPPDMPTLDPSEYPPEFDGFVPPQKTGLEQALDILIAKELLQKYKKAIIGDGNDAGVINEVADRIEKILSISDDDELMSFPEEYLKDYISGDLRKKFLEEYIDYDGTVIDFLKDFAGQSILPGSPMEAAINAVLSSIPIGLVAKPAIDKLFDGTAVLNDLVAKAIANVPPEIAKRATEAADKTGIPMAFDKLNKAVDDILQKGTDNTNYPFSGFDGDDHYYWVDQWGNMHAYPYPHKYYADNPSYHPGMGMKFTPEEKNMVDLLNDKAEGGERAFFEENIALYGPARAIEKQLQFLGYSRNDTCCWARHLFKGADEISEAAPSFGTRFAAPSFYDDWWNGGGTSKFQAPDDGIPF